MKVSFIIPVFGHIELTHVCIKSLKDTVKDISYEIVIVDDGSDDETKEELQSLAGKDTRIVTNEENRGYAFSNNVGANKAKGEILFLINNDLEFLPGWFEPMFEAFEKVPNLGIVGNVQLNADTGYVDHSGYYVDWDGELLHKKTRNKGLIAAPKYSKFHLITGACCAIKKELFLRYNGFDESYTNGCEDIDLCMKLRRDGFRIVVANRSAVKHKVSATRGEASLKEEANFRTLQEKWKDKIAHLAALKWPDQYVKTIKSQPRSFKYRIAKQAIPRWLGIKKGAATIGLHLAYSKLARNERHWQSVLDELSDEEIKDAQRKQNANWLSDKFIHNKFEQKSIGQGVWIKEDASITIPRGLVVAEMGIRGEVQRADPENPVEKGRLGLKVTVNDSDTRIYFPIEEGEFYLNFENPPVLATEANHIEIQILGVAKTNSYAFLGRILDNIIIIPRSIRRKLKSYRTQDINKRLAIHTIEINQETVLDFKKNPTSPFNFDYARKYGNIGINLIGWFKAELGIGESVRLAAKAIKATAIEHCLIPLKVNCLSDQGDTTYEKELTASNPYPINVFHIDAPQSADIDHHHGERFRKGKRNVAYWAWELPEFPDHWIKYFKYFDEIWAPSNFVRDSIIMKSPLPVVTIPHCIQFSIPVGSSRSRFNLPSDKFLFLFAYDLNSYQERKNPKASIEAFKKAFSPSEQEDVGLVIKIHSSKNNQESLDELKQLLRGVQNCYLIDETLTRDDVYKLMNSVDCYVSLHRSEGFGLTIAESMYLGKPVVATNWSANSEFINETNSCPVNFELVKLKHTHGPYLKGQFWADPDTDHAARFMRRLFRDSDFRNSISEAASKTIRDRFSPEAVGGIYAARLRSIALWS